MLELIGLACLTELTRFAFDLDERVDIVNMVERVDTVDTLHRADNFGKKKCPI